MRTGIAVALLRVKQGVFKRGGIDSIPLEPKIPLKNYLLDLVTTTDGKESSIYLRGVEKFIQEIWAGMVTGNWRKLKIEIIRVLEIHPMSFYAYKNGRKAISIQMMYKLLQLWKIYCQKSARNIKRKWNEIYKSNFSFSVHKGFTPTKLPKYITPRLSYLIGWICGDGHMANYGSHYLVKISEKSLEELLILQALIKDLFSIKPPIFQIYKGGYALQFGNKPIFRFLTQVLKVKVGAIPEIIDRLDSVNKRHFLAGIFDSEGYVSKTRNRITISQGNLKFLKKVALLSNEIGVEFFNPITHKTSLGTWYTIRVDGKSEILKFADLIGSYHVDKSSRLKKLILKNA